MAPEAWAACAVTELPPHLPAASMVAVALEASAATRHVRLVAPTRDVRLVAAVAELGQMMLRTSGLSSLQLLVRPRY